MKPFPPELLALYPPDPMSTRLKDRPWWASNVAGFGGEFIRFGQAGFTCTAENAGHAARLDAEHPLPFPGVRVGQTWALCYKTGQPAAFTITEYDSDRDAGKDGRVRPWFAGGAWIADAELRDLCAGGFLLADVACPWVAPWSGVENG